MGRKKLTLGFKKKKNVQKYQGFQNHNNLSMVEKWFSCTLVIVTRAMTELWTAIQQKSHVQWCLLGTPDLFQILLLERPSPYLSTLLKISGCNFVLPIFAGLYHNEARKKVSFCLHTNKFLLSTIKAWRNDQKWTGMGQGYHKPLNKRKMCEESAGADSNARCKTRASQTKMPLNSPSGW